MTFRLREKPDDLPKGCVDVRNPCGTQLKPDVKWPESSGMGGRNGAELLADLSEIFILKRIKDESCCLG